MSVVRVVAFIGRTYEFSDSGFDCMNKVKQGVYRHYKGMLYKVFFEATHSETGEEVVAYQCLYGDYSFWVRPTAMFTGFVEVAGKSVPRFEFVPGED